ncbi:MAG: hypothetical protein M3291_05445 [Actinomycetota bacterium]|nr:hypothetical protein [Actinomycetota bacterium]
MSGYQVIIDALHQSGDVTEGVGEQVGTVDLAGTLAGVADALPGGRSVQAATGTAQTWADQIERWSTDAQKLGQGMSASAERYAASEDAAEADLGTAYWVG